MSVVLLLVLTETPAFNPEVDFLPTIEFLASDEMEGRRAGAPFADSAARWIAARLEAMGAQPLFEGGWFQGFPVRQTDGYDSTETSALLIVGGDTTELAVGDDFVPISLSKSGDVELGLLFAGFGISSTRHQYDDYHGADAEGKAVVVLRHEPRETDSAGVFGAPFPSTYSDLRYKAKNGREHGAKALVVISDLAAHEGDEDRLMTFRKEAAVQDGGLLAIHLKRSVLEKYIPVDSLQAAIEGDLEPHPFTPEGVTLKLSVKVNRTEKSSSNVAGWVEGTDPALKGKYILIGAHYDHLGWGGAGSGALDPDEHLVHNGADDNASGVAMTLALLEKLKENPLKHPVAAAFWGAEEIGALGSDAFAKSPPFDLENLLLYLNFDMVGRLNDEKSLSVSGTGTAEELEALVEALDKAQSELSLMLSPEGFGGSDHMNLYLAGVPVLFYFTGAHEDYHTATDDADKINLAGMESVARFTWLTLEALDTVKGFTYAETSGKGVVSGLQTGETKRTAKLGVIPDYAYQGKGMRLSGVKSEGPGGKAGMQKGDVIVEIAGKAIDDIYAYMYAMQEVEPGTGVLVAVERDGKRVEVTVELPPLD